MKKAPFFVIVLCLTALMLFGCRKQQTIPSPEEIVSSLYPDAEISQFSINTRQTLLPIDHSEDILNAFSRAGYTSIKASALEYAKDSPRVLAANGTIVTLQKTDGGIRVLWDDCTSDISALLSPNESTGTGEIPMVQIGVERQNAMDNPMIGMCYVYKLSDGSAVILDGGLPGNADNLYHTLEKLDIVRDENGRYRIAAWIFSHGHVDHYGAFMTFSEKFKETTDISYVLYSFPTDTNVLSSVDCDVVAFSNHIRIYYPNAVHVTPHAGLKYHFDNLTLEMLYTPEMLPFIDYYNDTSLIFIANVSGARVLHTGDAGNNAAEAVFSAYETDAFRADILQIAHHGLYTGAEEDPHIWDHLRSVYEASDAKFALLPMGTRLSSNARNGRWTVINQWAHWNFQTEFLFDNRPSETNICSDSQTDYEQFIGAIAEGTSQYETLCGYNGVNVIVSKDGLITYIMSSETENMATVFSLSETGAKVVSNTPLKDWLK